MKGTLFSLCLAAGLAAGCATAPEIKGRADLLDFLEDGKTTREQVLMNLIGAPGGKGLWKERAYLFGEEFRRHVEDDLMKRTPHPDAKPLGAFSIGRPSE